MWWKPFTSRSRARHRPHDSVPQAQTVQVRGGGELAKPIHLVGAGLEPPDFEILGDLAAALARTFEVNCHIDDTWLDVRFAFNAQRGQYYATQILERLVRDYDGDRRVIGVTSLDLFVPVLTFVFGEAQLEGNCAVVSYHRLIEPDRPDLLRDRLAKEAVHELGHTFGLRHCHDWECVMSSSHAVERLDVKSAAFCPVCRRKLF